MNDGKFINLKHFTLWGILGLRVFHHFGPKNQKRKINLIHQDFELCQASKYDFACQTKIIDTFWSRAISSI